MVHGLANNDALLGQWCTRVIGQGAEVALASGQDEKVRGDHLERTQVLVGHTEHLVRLI